jgi:hypothetical protein
VHRGTVVIRTYGEQVVDHHALRCRPAAERAWIVQVVQANTADVCPWNREFAHELGEGSPFAVRVFIARNNPVTLATDILALDQQAFSTAFRKSPMKRAKVHGFQRKAAVVLANTRDRSITPSRRVNCEPNARRVRSCTREGLVAHEVAGVAVGMLAQVVLMV